MAYLLDEAVGGAGGTGTALTIPLTDQPMMAGIQSLTIPDEGLALSNGTLAFDDSKNFTLTPLTTGVTGTALSKDSLVKLNYGSGENQGVAFGQTDANGALIPGSITTNKSTAAAMYTSKLPEGAFATAAQKAQQADYMRDTFGVDVNEGYRLMNTEADVRTKNANAGYAEAMKDQALWSITRDKIQLGMQVGGMGLALYDKILQNMYQNHRMDMEDRMMTLAETKETNRYDLQTTFMEKESTLKDSAMKYDYKTAKLNAGTEKYKAKLAADVKRSKIKQDSVRDLFFRNQYPYGNTYNAYHM